mgnify:CR=1 FL=1
MDNFLIHARFFSLFAFYPREIECVESNSKCKISKSV